MSILEFCDVGAEEAAQPDKTLTFDLADVRRSHPEAVVAFRVFELESELGGWVADSTEVARQERPNLTITSITKWCARPRKRTSPERTRLTHG